MKPKCFVIDAMEQTALDEMAVNVKCIPNCFFKLLAGSPRIFSTRDTLKDDADSTPPDMFHKLTYFHGQ